MGASVLRAWAPAVATVLLSITALPGCFLTNEKLAGWLGDDTGLGETDTDIDFVTVGAQTFDMGCTPGQSNCGSDESPVMPVTLTRDYLVSRMEITQAQFEAVMGYNPAEFTRCGSDCPVETVTWHEAAAFANGVSAAEGLAECYLCSGSGSSVVCESSSDPYTCEGYRLLTEAEWEAAARCGEDTLYAGSDDAGAVAWTSDNAGNTTHPVASLAPNACGLYDLTGNLWEWTQDWYDDDYYTGAGRTDPMGPSAGSYRVNRGGGWTGSPEFARVANRLRDTPSSRGAGLGLRLARSVP